MASPSQSPSPSADDPPRREPEPEPELERDQEVIHRTKTIQFRGRSLPIVLQNDNGPCPLIAICNVLLLKNQLTLSPDVGEVSQQKLLAMVAERLIDSNNDLQDKDEGYVENQQRNISDAIDLLPRLTTGIDVNVKFRKIDEFEFTRECAIFDLLGIPLYHGWLVDPQDHETTEAIGSKSYNTLTGELVSLETLKMEQLKAHQEDPIDFVAATTATLGVPSPSLSRARSFEDSPRSPSAMLTKRKGDTEEEEELLRVLKISEAELSTVENDSLAPISPNEAVAVNSDSKANQLSFQASTSVDMSDQDPIFYQDPTLHGGSNIPRSSDSNLNSPASIPEPEDTLSFKVADVEQGSLPRDSACQSISNALVQDETPSSPIHEKDADDSQDGLLTLSSDGTRDNIEKDEYVSSNFHGAEPIYEGEECISDSRSIAGQDGEPVYEGEALLAKQADKGSGHASGADPVNKITPRQGELISDFLRNNSSQLTIHGLFSLREGLHENELCVFFRNNHFSTMFKFEGELYLLATDQGYLNQPDLVWEKLNEVNGDTLFMTNNFKEFRLESVGDSIWDGQNAVSSSAGYLDGIGNSSEGASTFESDRLLAESLQQQEYEQQEQQQQRSTRPAPSSSSRLMTGPQVPRTSAKPSSSSSSSSSPKQNSKLKDNCCIM